MATLPLHRPPAQAEHLHGVEHSAPSVKATPGPCDVQDSDEDETIPDTDADSRWQPLPTDPPPVGPTMQPLVTGEIMGAPLA